MESLEDIKVGDIVKYFDKITKVTEITKYRFLDGEGAIEIGLSNGAHQTLWSTDGYEHIFIRKVNLKLSHLMREV